MKKSPWLVLGLALTLSASAVKDTYGVLSVTIAGGGDSPLYTSDGTPLADATLQFELVVDDNSDTQFGLIESSGMLNLFGDTVSLGVGSHENRSFEQSRCFASDHE